MNPPPDLFTTPFDKFTVEAASEESDIQYDIFSDRSITKETALKNIRKMLESSEEEPVSFFSETKTLQIKFDRGTSIESEAVIDALFDLIQTEEELKGIERLDFINCEFITCAFRALINRLSTTAPHITSLCFEMCNLNFIHSGQLFNVETPLRNHLKAISISGQTIDVMFMGYLAKFLEGDPALEILVLIDDHIRDPEVQKLCDGLKKNKTLKGLYLKNNGITDKGAMAIAWMLRTHPTIEALSLKDNKIGDAGAIALGQVLHDRKSPAFNLGIEANPFGDEGASYLIEQGDSLSMLGLSNAGLVNTLTALDTAIRRKGYLPWDWSKQASLIGKSGSIQHNQLRGQRSIPIANWTCISPELT